MGEGASAPIESLPKERNHLQQILSHFQDENIFNADETGLFFRMTPNQTLASGPVIGKKRVIILLYSCILLLNKN